MEEVWKDIPGYEGCYQASSEGRIRSLDRVVNGRYNNTQLKKGRILKPHISCSYIGAKPRWRASLYKDDKKYTPVWSHCIWSAFNGTIPEGMQVNHIDENPENNKLENLNLMTPKENTNYGTGIMRQVRKNRKPVTQILPDGTEFRSFFSARDANKETGINQCDICSCCKGRKKTAGGYKWRYAERETV